MSTAFTVRFLTPLLVVRDAARAFDFYVDVLGARELLRYTNKVRGTVSHADIAVGESVFSLQRRCGR